MSATTETPMITMTPEAVRQLRVYLEEQGTPEAKLRVFVTPGGCSGLSYGMTVEDYAEDDDHIVPQDGGLEVLVDQFSAIYLEGAEIDYVNSLMGGGFTINNPNAVTSCACGSSFDTGENAGTSQGCGCGA